MNLRVVRKKTKSIKNVKKITKAMQMVSAVKMRKAQAADIESRPYREGLTELIGRLTQKVDVTEVPIFKVDTKGAKRELIILITSNKGLAGPFNVNIARYILRHLQHFETTDFLIIGAKGTQFINRLEGASILASFTSNSPITQVSALFDLALEKFQSGNYKTVSLIYNKFLSMTRSEVAHERLFPFHMEKKESTNEEKVLEYTVEPSPADILQELLLSYVESRIRGAIISSEAVEHSARMMAMKSATDNASEIIYSLTLLANRLRQEKITNELLDMITAKESVDTT